MTQANDEYLSWFNSNTHGPMKILLFHGQDWADNGTEYGISESIIKKGSDAEVAYTLTSEEF
ncbi:MAG: hypothetical protein AB7E42_00330 [Anaerotignaceae bacterium]